MIATLSLFVFGIIIIEPNFVLAAQTGGEGAALVNEIVRLVSAAVPIIIGLAVLVFLYGIAKYGISKDEKNRQEAVGIITYGIIALFVMVSIWGLVALISSTFKIQYPSGPLELNPKSVEDLY